MFLSLPNGTTSRIIPVKLTTLSTGADLTGVLYSDLIAYYKINGSAPVAITLATMTQGTWASGGFIQVSAAHMPGEYELSVPNAAFASGTDVTICIQANGGTSAGMKTYDVVIQMDAYAALVNLVNTLTTYTGNTPQTGDSYARLGAPAGASVSADVAAVETKLGSPVHGSIALDIANVSGGGGGDPLTNTVPGSYAAHTAGNALGKLDQLIVGPG